jgi:hypothetical protein
MIKVLLYQLKESAGNPYIYEMSRILQKQGIVVTIGSDDFWDKKGDYDLINLQWPEELCRWHEPTDENLAILEETLKYWKEKSKIVVTRHNIIPHNYKDNQRYNNLYLTVFRYADGILHMGEFSRSEYLERYQNEAFLKNLVHGIVPHPIYTAYENFVSREVARRELGIPLDKTVILIFGNIRNREEKLFIHQVFRKMKHRKKYLLVSWYPLKSFKGSRFINPLIGWWLNLKPNEKNFYDQVPMSRVQYFFNASDVFFIQRRDNLNSGLIFLGFAYAKILVGPGVTNIKDILEKTKNFVFDPNRIEDVADALDKACDHVPDKETILQNIRENYPSEDSIGQSFLKFAREVISTSRSRQ